VHLIAETSTSQRQREQYAPPEPQRTREQALEIMLCAMRRREAEALAVQQAETAEAPQARCNDRSATPPGRSPELEAEPPPAICAGPPASRGTISKEPDWPAIRQTRGGHASQRELQR
jgi:hypothetical protein